MAIESKLRRPAFPAYQPPTGSSEAPQKGGWKRAVVWLVVLAILAAVGYIIWIRFFAPSGDVLSNLSQSDEGATTVADGTYQAVFLDNGQVYFGRLQDRDGDFFRLTDVYYLEFRQNPQAGEAGPASDADASLVKLGSELHGPEDAMDINREHILFIEELKGDSKVSKAIADYLNKKAQ